jgi:hypothetical protein
MAANAFANAAAAVSAGWIKTNTDRGVAPIGAGNAGVYPASERFQTIFSKPLAGATAEAGSNPSFIGYGVDQNTAELQALANLNKFRDNRYGADSAAASAAVIQPSAIKDATTAAVKHTKDTT